MSRDFTDGKSLEFPETELARTVPPRFRGPARDPRGRGLAIVDERINGKFSRLYSEDAIQTEQWRNWERSNRREITLQGTCCLHHARRKGSHQFIR